jgi:AraC family transcriptional regulator, arabinose operon regulatory protein
MTTSYFTIMMKHFESMQIEVMTSAETVLSSALLKDREDVYDCNRFLFVKEGQGRIVVRGNEIALTKGTLCALLSGVPHKIVLEESERLTLLWCHFRSNFEDREIYRTLQMPFFTRIEQCEEVGKLFRKMIEEQALDRSTSKLRVKSTMLELISLYLENLPDNLKEDAPSQDLQKIDLVLQYIDDHLSENITVEDLAKQVYLHPNYFIVFFKSIIGNSPIQYVNQRRMEIAKELLGSPECNVSAVASRVGMQIYYFSRMFKAHTGLTPSRYRKQAMAIAGGEG